MIRYADQMLANIDSQKEQVVDARAQARFDGIAPEPRAGLRGGHIPGSVCVPFIDVIDDDKTMLPAADIKEAFTSAGLDLKKPIVATCGSGVSAAMLVFAMHLIGQRQNAVYDGSWTEWGGREDLPIEA